MKKAKPFFKGLLFLISIHVAFFLIKGIIGIWMGFILGLKTAWNNIINFYSANAGWAFAGLVLLMFIIWAGSKLVAKVKNRRQK